MHCATILVLPFQYSQIILMHYISFVGVYSSHFTLGKIRFMPPQLREFGFHVENHATQWHGFQHEIQFQEVVVAWIQLTLICYMQ